MNHPTEQDYAESAAEIAANPVTLVEIARARKFIETFAYSTTALKALCEAMRAQYAEHRELDCAVVDGEPCADILSAVLPVMAAAEAREV